MCFAVCTLLSLLISNQLKLPARLTGDVISVDALPDAVDARLDGAAVDVKRQVADVRPPTPAPIRTHVGVTRHVVI